MLGNKHQLVMAETSVYNHVRWISKTFIETWYSCRNNMSLVRHILENEQFELFLALKFIHNIYVTRKHSHLYI